MPGKYYAGVGSRATPLEVQALMRRIARSLEKRGYILRSGRARGADLAFESGTTYAQVFFAGHATDETRTLARHYHPAPERLYGDALDLMARNAYQVLGPQLDEPSEFVVCWTPDGTEKVTSRATGGTGQAIRIAVDHGIPVFNLYNSDAVARLKVHLDRKS